jgi:tetratricopeptide (TPR) repeat protein
MSVPLYAQQIVAQNNKASLQKRSDSIAQIRKYKASKHYQDSAQSIRNQQLNTIKLARKHIIDSITYARKKALDSAVAMRKTNTQQLQQRLKIKSDSIAAIRKYKSSKRYTDSLTRLRNYKIDSMRLSRTHYFDAIRAARKKSLDSTLIIRKAISDALKAKQKSKADSIATIRKYKESRRYRDSVQVTRQSKLDSIRIVRKNLSDKIIAQRKKTVDSLTKVRKTKMEALNKLRKQKADSLKAIQDKRIETLAKQKEQREKELKAEQKRRQDKMKLALEIKIKKKHEAWSNEQMLKKKWSLLRQVFQNTYTRYNYYYNARRKMQEANLNMQRRKKDNFEKTIDLFPFDPNTDSTVFASDMDSIVHKASVGIQIHDPRTKWADDLYLLMGQSYYYKGDFERAKSTFKYVISMKSAVKKKKKKNTEKEQANALVKQDNKTFLQKLIQHKPAHNDAVLWLTRTDADSKKEAEAEAILDLMDASVQLSEHMKNKIALEKANLYVKKGDLREASKYLITVESSKEVPKYIRQRAAFLNGQLLNEMGLYDSAAQRYTKVLALHPTIEMDFYAHKNRANAIAQSGADQSASIATMKRLLKDGKYAPYHEQVYYILGKLSANNHNTDEALDYYYKSVQQPKTTTKQKAITYAAIGNIQYQTGKYNLAKRSYDSAAYFAKNKLDNEEVKIALKRSKSLDKIEEPYYTVQIQDSLLYLSEMSEKEQKTVIKKYIKYLEKQKEDSIANVQNVAAAGSLAANNNGNASANWYFSSSVAVQQGYNEFKRKWGNRPLTDNWRRASASSFGSELNAIAIDSNSSEENNGIDEASLWASIPKTAAQINAVKNKLKKAYVQLGKAYINDLNEFKDGLACLDSLDKKFPEHEYGDEVMYWRYTAALRQSQLEEAELLRTQIIAQYPNSTYAERLSNTTDTTQANDEDISNYYQNTYQLAKERQHKEVLQRVKKAQRSYGDPSYARKFRILEAQSLTALGDYKKADTLLAEYIKEFPSDSLRPWIDAILKHINIKRAADTLHKDSTINKSLSDSLATIQKKALLPDEYTYEPKEIHYCVFIFNRTDASVAAFKAGLGDYSSIKFSGLSLNSTFEGLNETQSLVITKSFGNASQAKIFLKSALKEPMLFRDLTDGSYQACIISERNYRKLKLDKKAINYLNFYQKNY